MTTKLLIENEGFGKAEGRPAFLLVYFLLGIAFGIVLTRSEVLS